MSVNMLYVQRHYGSDEKETVCMCSIYLFFFAVSDLRCHLRKGPLSQFMVVLEWSGAPSQRANQCWSVCSR